MTSSYREGYNDSQSEAGGVALRSNLNSVEIGSNAEGEFVAQSSLGPPDDENTCLKQDRSLKTINDLPPEIIVQILHAVLEEIVNLPYFLGGYYLSALKDLAAVCTLWKFTIQNSPTFWTIIESTNTPDEMGYMLRKSGNCLVTFKHLIDSGQDVFPEGGFDGFDFLDFASSNMPRCSSLSVAVQWCSQAARILGSPAPNLREATIVASLYDIDEDLHLFDGQAGVLEDLRLTQVPIRWDLGLPPRLRRFEISYRSAPIKRLPHPQQIVSGLSSCPGVEVVHILGADMLFGHLAWAGLDVQRPTVKLPVLKVLTLENMSIGGSSYILRSLWAPSLRNLEVKERFQFDSVAALLHPPNPLLLESIRRALPHNQTLSLALESVRVALQIPGDEGHVGISVRCQNPDELSRWLAEEFPSELSSVTELRLRVSSTRHQSEFQGLRKLLEALSNVVRLVCSNVDGGAGVVLAEHLASAHQESDGWHWHWPKLTHMELGDAWKWPELALTMVRERYGQSEIEPEDSSGGSPKWHPSPLTTLQLNGMESMHPETFQDIERIVGKEALEEHGSDSEEHDGGE